MLHRLYVLVLAVIVFWLSCVMFGAGGLALCLLIFAVALVIAGRLSLAQFAFLVLGGLLFISLLLPGATFVREAARRMVCMNNLRQINLALIAYKNCYQSFPPPYLADKNGRPMHSWRVLILPYLDQKPLYDRYNFNEPWNGPNNRKLLSARPSVYVCPSDEGARAKGATQTSYVAVVGTKAAWRTGSPRSLADAELHDHFSTTILLAETANNIAWTEPRDVSLDAIQMADAPSDLATVSSKHGCYYHDFFYDYESDTPRGASVLAADGHVSFLPLSALSPRYLQNILKIGGFNEDAIDRIPDLHPRQEPQIHATFRWRTCIALAVWFALVGLLFGVAWRSRKAAGSGRPSDGSGLAAE